MFLSCCKQNNPYCGGKAHPYPVTVEKVKQSLALPSQPWIYCTPQRQRPLPAPARRTSPAGRFEGLRLLLVLPLQQAGKNQKDHSTPPDLTLHMADQGSPGHLLRSLLATLATLPPSCDRKQPQPTQDPPLPQRRSTPRAPFISAGMAINTSMTDNSQPPTGSSPQGHSSGTELAPGSQASSYLLVSAPAAPSPPGLCDCQHRQDRTTQP